MQANRNGFFYIIDRATGKLDLVESLRQGHLEHQQRRKRAFRSLAKNGAPTPEGNRVCPGAAGATNWMSPTYDPQTKLFYVTAREQCDIFSTAPQPFEKGHAYYGSAYFPNDDAAPFWGALRAIDPTERSVKVGMEASFANMVGSAFNRGRIGVHRRRGREFYGAGGGDGKSLVALSVWSVRIFVADVVCRRWQTVCRGGRG